MTVKPNPWGLSPCEVAAMSAMCQYGCQKTAAIKLGKSLKTIQAQTQTAAKKMKDHRTSLSRFLAWDRWWRESGVPIENVYRHKLK